MIAAGLTLVSVWRQGVVVSSATGCVDLGTEPLQSESDFALDRSDRLVELQRDLGVGQAAEEREVKHAVLCVGECG